MPPLSLSTLSAKPGGLPLTPVQGVVSLRIANGDGVSACRPPTVVNAPVDAPGRAATSSQRASAANAAAPKSSETVNSP